MNANLITAEDYSLFLNCLQNIITSDKEYTVLLTNKDGKYMAQYQENTSENDLEGIYRKTDQNTIKAQTSATHPDNNATTKSSVGINQQMEKERILDYVSFATNGKGAKHNSDENIHLTQREIEVVTLVAKEYTTQEIADTLFLSKHTIESYRKNLISKLNVRNLAGLTKYALKMQYITLDTAS